MSDVRVYLERILSLKNENHAAMYIMHYIPLNAQNEIIFSSVFCMIKFARTAGKNVIF